MKDEKKKTCSIDMEVSWKLGTESPKFSNKITIAELPTA